MFQPTHRLAVPADIAAMNSVFASYTGQDVLLLRQGTGSVEHRAEVKASDGRVFWANLAHLIRIQPQGHKLPNVDIAQQGITAIALGRDLQVVIEHHDPGLGVTPYWRVAGYDGDGNHITTIANTGDNPALAREFLPIAVEVLLRTHKEWL